ncbi:MAG: ZIP family metal transporter [Halanaerobiaceae bacterium]
MNYLTYITIIGLLSGIIGTGVGGLSVLILKKIRSKILGILLGFSAGIMTVIVFLDLIPEAIEKGNLINSLIGIVLGVGFISFIDLKFPHQHFSFVEEMNKENQQYFKTGVLLCLGIALHNIPEGLAIGAGFMSSVKLGVGLAVLIALHNLPEGMAVATALGLANLKEINILLITILAGVPMGLGAALGGYMGGISPEFLSIALGLAGGAMLYIVYDELVPNAHENTRGHSAIAGIIIGIITGMILIEFLH